MIPPQLAIFAAKHAKKLLVLLAVAIVVAGTWFAVNMHERTVEKLAASEAARAAQVIAQETTIASLDLQKEATARWQESAKKYQRTLDEQKRVQAMASEEGRRISATLRAHDLERLARAKPTLLERTVNRATARSIRLLNCGSTPSGCLGDHRVARPLPADPVPPAAVAGNLQVDADGPRPSARPGPSLLLSQATGLRSSGT